MNLRNGLLSIARGLADIASFGEFSAQHARDIAGVDDPRPGHIKDAGKMRGDWEAVANDLKTVMTATTHQDAPP